MKYAFNKIVTLVICITVSSNVYALQRPEMDFKIFQFPRNMIPSIDDKTDLRYFSPLSINKFAFLNSSNSLNHYTSYWQPPEAVG